MSDGDDSRAQTNSLDELVALLLSINPVHLATKAIDEGGKALNQSRRVVELLISTLENTSVTMNNLNQAATRVNRLLDDVEEPLRAVMPLVGTSLSARAQMGDIAKNLGDLTKRLGPLTAMAENAGSMFGIRPNKPASGA
jgi:ABC-type transporter Mla subunit MlaD